MKLRLKENKPWAKPLAEQKKIEISISFETNAAAKTFTVS
jgi:hypothetical protein